MSIRNFEQLFRIRQAIGENPSGTFTQIGPKSYMTDHDKLPDEANRPLNHVWNGLLAGDPGPFVTFFDSLMNSDFPFGAGGLLRDLADRIVSAGEEFEGESERDAASSSLTLRVGTLALSHYQQLI